MSEPEPTYGRSEQTSGWSEPTYDDVIAMHVAKRSRRMPHMMVTNVHEGHVGLEKVADIVFAAENSPYYHIATQRLWGAINPGEISAHKIEGTAVDRKPTERFIRRLNTVWAPEVFKALCSILLVGYYVVTY